MEIETETALPICKLGRTGLEVTQLGFGTALRNSPDDVIDDDRVGRILNAVLDAGINFIDTAPDYGPSEAQIGRHLAARRLVEYARNADPPGPRLAGKRAAHSAGDVNVGVGPLLVY